MAYNRLQLLTYVLSTLLPYSEVPTADAAEFEKMGTAIMKALGTKAALNEKVKLDGETYDVFFTKDRSRYAVVQKGLYPPNCDHTWVIGLDKSTKVREVRVLEMTCPHALPTNKKSFLVQYKGKSIKNLDSLKKVSTVAKATGTSKLTTEAVKKSIKIVEKMTK